MSSTTNERPVTHRFALCLSGGVALGSYIAGALTQLYRDLAVLNERSELKGRARFVLDVIAGSSAGSVTGLILSRALVAKASPAAFERAMRACWVSGLTIESLMQPVDDPANAPITDRCLQEVARRTFDILQVPESAGAPPVEETVALWMTMTNLDGIPYHVDFKRPGRVQSGETSFYAFNYRDYDPYFVAGNRIYRVNMATEALGDDAPPWRGFADPSWRGSESSWDTAIETATASGAFPIAFPSHPLRRDLSLYGDYQALKQDLAGKRVAGKADAIRPADLPDSATFQFVDGGLFNNQPIGRAIDAATFVAKVDPSRRHDHRTYLVIEPDPNTPASILEAMTACVQEAEAHPHGLEPQTVLGRMVGAYFNDALYSDFAKAADTNRRIQALADAFDQCPELTDEQKLAISQAVGMDYKRPITLDRIPFPLPERDRLAGDFMAHFGGFLREDLREADFRTGAREARSWLIGWLDNWLDANPQAAAGVNAERLVSHTGPADWETSDLLAPPEGPDLSSVAWLNEPGDPASLSNADREAALAPILARVGALIQRWLGPAGGVYVPVVGALLGGKIQQMAVDAAHEQRPMGWRAAVGRLAGTPAWPIFARLSNGLTMASILFVTLATLASVGVGAVIGLALDFYVWWLMLAFGVLGLLVASGLVGWVYRTYITPYLPVDLPGQIEEE